MTRPYGYEEGYQDGHEAAEIKLQAELEALKKAAQAVVNELQDCWENTPNKLEFIIGELAELLEDKL